MARKTKIIGLSLPPEINNQVEEYLKKSHKTRSEFFREMINIYFSNKPSESVTEKDLASLLKEYWNVKSSVGMEVIPIVLGVITNNKGEVLIGARSKKDEWVENLSWVFPGGKLKNLEIEQEVKRLVREETGLVADVKQLIAARVHPDSGFKKVQIVALYFHCTVENDKKIKVGGSLNKLKWVKPLDVFKYFTTSTCDEVTKFLTMLEKEK